MNTFAAKQKIGAASIVVQPRGATLLEVTVLLVLLVILAGIALPGISPVLQQLRLRAAAWQVAGDLRLARQRAVTMRQNFRICVTCAPSGACVTHAPLTTYSFDRNAVSGWESDNGALKRLPQDVTVSSNNTPVFYETGNATPYATFTLQSLVGFYEVRVSSTGRVLVCQGACPS